MADSNTPSFQFKSLPQTSPDSLAFNFRRLSELLDDDDPADSIVQTLPETTPTPFHQRCRRSDPETEEDADNEEIDAADDEDGDDSSGVEWSGSSRSVDGDGDQMSVTIDNGYISSPILKLSFILSCVLLGHFCNRIGNGKID